MRLGGVGGGGRVGVDGDGAVVERDRVDGGAERARGVGDQAAVEGGRGRVAALVRMPRRENDSDGPSRLAAEGPERIDWPGASSCWRRPHRGWSSRSTGSICIDRGEDGQHRPAVAVACPPLTSGVASATRQMRQRPGVEPPCGVQCGQLAEAVAGDDIRAGRRNSPSTSSRPRLMAPMAGWAASVACNAASVGCLLGVGERGDRVDAIRRCRPADLAVEEG